MFYSFIDSCFFVFILSIYIRKTVINNQIKSYNHLTENKLNLKYFEFNFDKLIFVVYL
jgi:hypothetical protein